MAKCPTNIGAIYEVDYNKNLYRIDKENNDGTSSTGEKTGTGKITQVVGVVVDIEFSTDSLPAIYNALTLDLNGQTLTLEVAQHLSESSVRAIALGSTDGLRRGVEVTDTGKANLGTYR